MTNLLDLMTSTHEFRCISSYTNIIYLQTRQEDVTQRYTQDFDAVKQRRKKNKSSM